MVYTRKASFAQATTHLYRRVGFFTVAVLSNFWALEATSAQEADSEIFPRPPELEPAISFWKKVYTEVDTDHGYLHDSQDLSVIYAPLNRNSREIETFRQRVKDDLDILATGKRTNLSESQEAILALWPEDVSNQRLRQAINDVRK